MKNKIFKIALTVICSIILLIFIVISAFSIGERIKYRDFHKNSEKGIPVPGLWSGFVPQGFDYIEESGVYITSGYMKNGDASRIYITSTDGKHESYVSLKHLDGSDNNDHAGGVSYKGEYIYITGAGEGNGEKNIVNMYKISDVLDGDGVAVAVDKFEVCVKPSCLNVIDGKLMVGEFYRQGAYETDPSHHQETVSGDLNPALIAVYELKENGKPDSIVPEYAYSVRGQVQGFEFDTQGRMILSTSYGLASSYIYIYDTQNLVAGEKEIDGEKITVFHVDGGSLKKTIEMPPMSEEMVLRGNTLMIMTESACMKYLYGKLIGANHVYNYDYSSIKFD